MRRYTAPITVVLASIVLTLVGATLLPEHLVLGAFLLVVGGVLAALFGFSMSIAHLRWDDSIFDDTAQRVKLDLVLKSVTSQQNKVRGRVDFGGDGVG